MAKRANGEGSIRKRSDGRWEARYVSPVDGRQRSIYGKTQKEVRQKLTQIMTEIDGGAYIDPTDMTVSRWLDVWLKDYCRDKKPTTLNQYKWAADAYIRPRAGSVQLPKLSKINVQRIVNDMLDEGLAGSTANTIRMVLSSAMQTAVDLGMVRSNPCAGIRIKREKQSTMAIVDRDVLPQFIAEAYKTPHGDILAFAIMTGLRAGELRGLRWSDIDMDSGRITVARQLAYVGGKYIIQTPKSAKERMFPLPAAALEILKKHRIAQQEDRMRCGARWIETDISRDLVFRMPDGSHYKVRALNYAVKKAGAAVGITDMSPHDLRHSFAVSAIRSGMDIKTVQHVLGHSSASITLDIYAHYTEDMGREAARRMDAYYSCIFNG